MNNIPDRQNQPEFLEMIVAAAHSYRAVGFFSMVQSALAILVAFGGFIVAMFLPSSMDLMAILSVFVLLIDALVIEPLARSKQDLGARIQELFDTRLLEIPWNSLRCQERPDPEDIHRLAGDSHANIADSVTREWYPRVVGDVEIEYARLLCQRTNLRWDSKLRVVYLQCITLSLIGVFCGVLLYGVISRMLVGPWIVKVVLPLCPTVLKLSRLAIREKEAASRSERAKRILEEVWKNGLDGKATHSDFIEGARRLQDEIYERRRMNPRVPRLLYLMYRGEFETEMRVATECLVAELKRSSVIKPVVE